MRRLALLHQLDLSKLTEENGYEILQKMGINNADTQIHRACFARYIGPSTIRIGGLYPASMPRQKQ